MIYPFRLLLEAARRRNKARVCKRALRDPSWIGKSPVYPNKRKGLRKRELLLRPLNDADDLSRHVCMCVVFGGLWWLDYDVDGLVEKKTELWMLN